KSSSGHHHFGAVSYAGTAEVGKGSGRFSGKYANTLDSIQQSFAASTEFGQHAASNDGVLCHLGNLIDREPTHHFAIRSFNAGNVGEEHERIGVAGGGARRGH